MEPVIPSPSVVWYGKYVPDHPLAVQAEKRKSIFPSLDVALHYFETKRMTKGWYVYYYINHLF
jgi:hypothetical protein